MRTAISVVVLAMAIGACDPCAGTPSCHPAPEISQTGQFIERQTGDPVAGVHVAFVRRRGAPLASDSVTAVSDADGFFALRTGALQDGVVDGSLIVEPPPPYAPYTVPGIRVSTHRKRGDGDLLGRLVVNPYLQFIGELHDRQTFAVVSSATIIVRQLGLPLVDQPTTELANSDNGRFMWEPRLLGFGALDVEFEISAPGYPRSYRIRDTITPQYLVGPPRFDVLLVGGGWAYVGEVMRRGTREFLPGVTVSFVRTGGIQSQPNSFSAPTNTFGRFAIPLTPLGDGTLLGDLIIRPPLPLQPETLRNVEIKTFDGGGTRVLGPFGYGAGTIVRPTLLYRATGKPVKEGTHVRVYRVAGLPITPAYWGVVPDSGIRIVDSTGVVGYDAGTADTGVVLYDFESRLNEPHAWDTVRAVSVPARFSDKDFVDTLRVGLWLPWTGVLRDANTNAPVSGATVVFQRTGGGRTRPRTITVQSAADGTFPVQPEPLDREAVQAVLRVKAGGLYRDTLVSIAIQPTQDDTVRSIGVIRLTRLPP